jgi:hypothetical protein
VSAVSVVRRKPVAEWTDTSVKAKPRRLVIEIPIDAEDPEAHVDAVRGHLWHFRWHPSRITVTERGEPT